MNFFEALAEQRWDDHRYYHHNHINQSLHLVSALAFIAAYVLLFVMPAAAVLIAWLVAMPSRQIGHFFFEPHDYDRVNHATHAHKEAIKVGYNLQRKVVLLAIWIAAPVPLLVDPTLAGLVPAPTDWLTLANRVAMLWLAIGVGAVLFRTVQLFYLRDVQTGLVWAAKILTDPFHDIKLYHRAPLQLFRHDAADPEPSREAG